MYMIGVLGANVCKKCHALQIKQLKHGGKLKNCNVIIFM